PQNAVRAMGDFWIVARMRALNGGAVQAGTERRRASARSFFIVRYLAFELVWCVKQNADYKASPLG
ncbi:MAG: hypothetical protein JWQ87_3950, partial [Candidatus Sulfotelmatobacter sp.]|nr:hypothetical protein [Candidatus Sulfotelmatobacter sp.]